MLLDMRKKLDISSEYADLVDSCSKNRENFLIRNSDVSHAKYLMCHLIGNSEEDIRIYSGDLNEAVYEDLDIQEALVYAVYRRVKVAIIVEKRAVVKEGTDSRLRELYNKHRIKVLKIPKKFKTGYRFLLSDRTGFRIEEPHDSYAFKENKIFARANFNDEFWCCKFIDAFNALVEKSIKY